jgi:arabinoxylan arabinofuranohydrolase
VLQLLSHRRHRFISLLSLWIGIVRAATLNFTFHGNPWIRHNTSADPDAHVWDGVVWVYCSMDGNLREYGLDSNAFAYDYMDGYHAFSSTDMINWVDHGEIFHSRNSPWGPSGWMWAPSAYWNGKRGADAKYYLYYPHKDFQGIWRIGVAIAPSPVGPFIDIGAPIDGVSGIDPCVFQDDDQQVYLYYNSAMVVRLKYNLIEAAETPRSIDYGASSIAEEMKFEEGSYMHKYNGKYYYSYSNWKAKDTTAYYGIGTSPYGPFEWKGALSGTKPGSQDHHSIIQFQGTWYYFFHRDTHPEEKKALNWYGHRRIACIEKMYYNADGTIKQVDPSSWTMNVGGAPHLAGDGTEYQWDQWYSDGNSQTETLIVPISGTVDDPLYQSYRYGGQFTYDVPMANDEYQVTLKFAEVHHDAAGKRQFRVDMEGENKIMGLDVFARVGMNKAYDEVHTVSVLDNELNIHFTANIDAAMIAAIDIQPVPKPTPAPTQFPSRQPTWSPTPAPSVAPTSEPSEAPSSIPTMVFSDEPSAVPSVIPTAEPSVPPSVSPNPSPSEEPSPGTVTRPRIDDTSLTASPSFSHTGKLQHPVSGDVKAITATPTVRPTSRLAQSAEMKGADAINVPVAASAALPSQMTSFVATSLFIFTVFRLAR